ncbi:MAG TPA: hypothetical protein VNK43_08805 [Gemmatimonadales bacterium]|nr:hypothetical protein [Gemmatimonadales bacterium]
MRCERCGEREALERDGRPARLHLFGEIDGHYCAGCARRLQEPYEAELRRAIAEQAPDLTDEELARFPEQMLRFTLHLPLPGVLPRAS